MLLTTIKLVSFPALSFLPNPYTLMPASLVRRSRSLPQRLATGRRSRTTSSERRRGCVRLSAGQRKLLCKLRDVLTEVVDEKGLYGSGKGALRSEKKIKTVD